MYIIIFILLGLFTGSFLNVCIDRLPRDRSIVFPPSHCESCGHKLRVLDLVPVFSWLFLRGRCRYCRAKIPARLAVVELVTALLFGFFFRQFGLSLDLAVFMVYSCFLVIIFVIDLEHQLVLNKVVYPGMVIAFAFSFFRPDITAVDGLGSGGIHQAMVPFASEMVNRMILALAGGVLGLVVMTIPYVVYPGGMGMGDIKLAALAGLMTGYPLIVLALLFSWILGGLIAAVLLVLKIKGRKDAIPAAVFMAVAVLVTLLWGQDIWLWYF